MNKIVVHVLNVGGVGATRLINPYSDDGRWLSWEIAEYIGVSPSTISRTMKLGKPVRRCLCTRTSGRPMPAIECNHEDHPPRYALYDNDGKLTRTTDIIGISGVEVSRHCRIHPSGLRTRISGFNDDWIYKYYIREIKVGKIPDSIEV